MTDVGTHPMPTATRVVTFAGSSVRIDAVGSDALSLVRFLFDAVVPAEGPPPHVTLRVAAHGAVRALYVDDILYCERESVGSLASAVQDQALFHLSDRSTGGLLLHAAAVCRGTQTVLLPGTSGAGKSSLAAWLTSHGFAYLTDELVFIPSGTLDVVPFVRPLSLKASARQTVGADVIDFAALSASSLTSPEVSLIQAAAFGAIGHAGTPELAAIVFPRFSLGAPLRIEPLSKADTGLELMSGLINARNLPGHGFSEVTRLAKLIPGSLLEYGAFSQLGAWTTDLALALGAAR